MAINRFSRGPIAADIQSTFMPMPLDLIDRQLDRRQQSYDTTKQSLSESQESYHGVKAHSADYDTLQGIVGQYDDSISQAVDQAGGDYSKLGSVADSIGREVAKQIQSGHLGAIHGAYMSAQETLKSADERRMKGDLRESSYNRILDSIQAYGGTVENENGSYSTPRFYTGVAKVEIDEKADKYSEKIVEQFRNSGERYRSVQEMMPMVVHNLWNDSGVLDNAKDEVWQVYGDVDENTENLLVDAYLQDVALNAVRKREFEQKFKLTESEKDSLYGGNEFTYTIQGGRSKRGIYNVSGLEDLSNPSRPLNVLEQIVASASMGMGRRSLGNYSKHTDLRDKEKEDKLVNELSEKHLIKDLAKIYGVDLTAPTVENLKKLSSVIEAANSQSVASSVTYTDNVKTGESFKRFVGSGSLVNFPITDVDTGKELHGNTDIAPMLKTNAEAKGDSKLGRIEYAGQIMTAGQHYPKGTVIANYYSPDSDKPLQTLAIDLGEYNVNSPEFKTDRGYAALKDMNGNPGGTSTYSHGNDTYTFLYMGDNIVHEYINGKFTGTPYKLTSGN